MAINHNKNVNLQITISKVDNESLLTIQKDLSNKMNIEFSKSQTIAFLIKSYILNTSNPWQSQNKEQREQDLINYRVLLNTLKSKLEKTYKELSEIIGISESTLKKYALGKQAPTGENKQKLNDAFKKYGIN